MRSSFGIQEGYKWQFCSRTHPPLIFASSIAFSALGPWSYPSEMLFIDSSFFFWLAKAVKLYNGSAPGSTKISGVKKVESLKDKSRSKGGGVTNYSPFYSTTYSLQAAISLSGRSTFRIQSLEKRVNSSSTPELSHRGKRSCNGLLLSKIFFH